MHQTEGVADGPHPKIRKLLPTIRKNDLIHALEENRWRIHFSTPEEVRRWILDHIADASLTGDAMACANAAGGVKAARVETGSLGSCA